MLRVREIPVPLGAQHPPPKHDILPTHEFTIGVISPAGSGKTTWMCNVMKYYEGYFNTILIFSPTVNNDEKWDWIKKQPLLGENKKLKKFLKSQQCKEQAHQKRDQNPIVARPPEHVAPPPHIARELETDDKKFDPKIPEACFMTEYNEDTLKGIMAEQQAMVNFLKAKKQTRHLANRILMIFDDLVGSELFSLAKDNPFKKLNSNRRHMSTSIMMVSQGYKEIPKTVRTNWSCLVLFEIASEGELKTIYEEFPMGMKNADWMKCYEYCVHGDYSFMYYNSKKPKRLRIMRNFEQVVYYDPKPVEGKWLDIDEHERKRQKLFKSEKSNSK